ncbi:MAG: hypothetical protein IPI67_17710 [Myxococcales bacterium]|nr:hypothetical protein [Myxococcales bacterium]
MTSLGAEVCVARAWRGGASSRADAAWLIGGGGWGAGGDLDPKPSSAA